MPNQDIKFDIGQRVAYQGNDSIMKSTVLSSAGGHLAVLFDHMNTKTYLIAAEWEKMELIDDPLVDFTLGRFFENFVIDGAIGYISVNTEMFPEDEGLDRSGVYHVYGIHPRHGSFIFTVRRDVDNCWLSEKHPSFIDGDFIDWVGECIEKKNI